MRKEGFEIPTFALLKKCLMFVDVRKEIFLSCKMRFVVSGGPRGGGVWHCFWELSTFYINYHLPLSCASRTSSNLPGFHSPSRSSCFSVGAMWKNGQMTCFVTSLNRPPTT